MNIQQAKAEIIHTFRAYTRRGADGAPVIPPEKQRPVLLIGPPGIGKTAIMKQIAGELGCGLVAYSMTHHTRQSAIGLPYIAQREYGGRTVSVTEYTMSEIVASIYNAMQATGLDKGILFLDEINCVSETLTPVILQLLQNKTFGNIPLPEDWIIVAAGNPPEYNRSVRALDMVTLDRVKHIEVEADLGIWQRYALERGVHPAVRAYLRVCPDHFYRIAETDRGQLFVTARGWEDLSLMLCAYEEAGVAVDADWFLQYLQYDEIARSFHFFYTLFRRFAMRLPDPDAGFSLARRLLAAPEGLSACSATECISLSAMLFHGIELRARQIAETQARLARRRELVARFPADGPRATEASLRAFLDEKRRALEIRVANGIVKPEDEYRERAVLAALEGAALDWLQPDAPATADYPAFVLSRADAEAARCRGEAASVAEAVEDAYRVLDLCPQGKSAALYFTGDLADSAPCAAILSEHPSPAHDRHLRQLSP